MVALALRVLILDSNIDAADDLASGLRASGHAVVLLRPCFEAVQAACHFGPDVVLCTYHPDDAGAISALRALRRLPGFDEVLVLVLAEPADTAEASQLGHAVVSHPVGASTIMPVIAGAILAHSGLMPLEAVQRHEARA